MSPLSPAKLAAVFDSVEWQMAVLDAGGEIVKVNEAWRAFGRENADDSANEVSAEGTNYVHVCQVTPPSEEFSGERAAEGIRAVLAGERQQFRMEYPCHAPDRKRWFLMSVTPLRGEPDGAVVSHIDITERKTVEDKLAYQALHDPLTDLPNRRLFMDRLTKALARQDRGEGRTAVAYLDLDHFKTINDRHGHDAGDAVLVQVAGRIDEAVRASDTAARLGGDEFAVLLVDVAAPGAALEATDRIIRNVAEPVTVEEIDARIRVSAGVAVSADDPESPDELLQRADRAMYRAKEEGVTRVLDAPSASED